MPRQSLLSKRLNAAFGAKMATLGIAALLLSACGGGGDSSSTGSDQSDGGSQAPDTAISEDGGSNPPPELDPVTPAPAPDPTPEPDETNEGENAPEPGPAPAPPPVTDGNGIGSFINGIPQTLATGIPMTCSQSLGGGAPTEPLGEGLLTVTNGAILVRSADGEDLYFRPSDANFSADPLATTPFTNEGANDVTVYFVALQSEPGVVATRWNVLWTTSTGAIFSLDRESSTLTPPFVRCEPS